MNPRGDKERTVTAFVTPEGDLKDTLPCISSESQHRIRSVVVAVKFLISFIVCAFALPASAQTDACLADLIGTFSFMDKGVLEPSLTIRRTNDGWEFKRPDGPSHGGEQLFRYHFDKGPTFPAEPVAQEHLSMLGRAMLPAFKDRHTNFDGIRTECGVTGDSIYLVRIDLTNASADLLHSMALWARALKKKPTSRAQ